MSDINLTVDTDLGVALVVEGPVQISSTTATPAYRFTQVTAAATWTVNHNLGRSANGTAYDGAGNQVGCDVQELSLNTIQFTFLEPRNGFAIIS